MSRDVSSVDLLYTAFMLPNNQMKPDALVCKKPYGLAVTIILTVSRVCSNRLFVFVYIRLGSY